MRAKPFNHKEMRFPQYMSLTHLFGEYLISKAQVLLLALLANRARSRGIHMKVGPLFIHLKN